MNYPAITTRRKIGSEKFHLENTSLSIALTDFWRWSASDLVSNATRGILAEFIVASALDLAAGVRKEWDAFDLKLTDGRTVEVKSAAYLQSWGHNELSTVSFSIRPTYAWDSDTNIVSPETRRQADIYVFCLLKHTEKDDSFDPMNLDQWEFYVLPCRILNEKYPTQKTIGLKSLLKLEPFKVKYSELRQSIEGLVS